MSRNQHIINSQIERLINDVECMSDDQIYQQYGIEFNEDGSLYDLTFKLKFDSISEWATFSVDQDYVNLDDSYRGASDHSQY